MTKLLPLPRGAARLGAGICVVIRRVELPFGGPAGRGEAHAVFSAYVPAVANADALPVVLPCMDGTWPETLVSAVDDVVLTGGPDVVADHARAASVAAVLVL